MYFIIDNLTDLDDDGLTRLPTMNSITTTTEDDDNSTATEPNNDFEMTTTFTPTTEFTTVDSAEPPTIVSDIFITSGQKPSIKTVCMRLSLTTLDSTLSNPLILVHFNSQK